MLLPKKGQRSRKRLLNDFERLFNMKKIINLVLILMFTGSVFGQQTVDYLLKARALTDEGKPDLAINQLTKAISEIKDSRLYLERAGANILKGDYSAAISDYNEANKLTPSSGEYGLSRVYSLKGDAATAVWVHSTVREKRMFCSILLSVLLKTERSGVSSGKRNGTLI
jgi:tetratricopeptide (TPR) repeat protein